MHVGSKKFAVVEFLTDGGDNGAGVSLVSSSWLRGQDKCYWPETEDARRLAKRHTFVGDSWSLWSCRILGTSGAPCCSVTIYLWLQYGITCLLCNHPIQFVGLRMYVYLFVYDTHPHIQLTLLQINLV